MRNLVQCINNSNENISVFDTIDFVRKSGYKKVFVQWYDHNWSVSQQEQVDYIKNSGLEIEFAHLGYDNINQIWVEGEIGDSLVEKYINNLECCAKNNIQMVIMHLTAKCVAPPPSQIGIDRIQKIADFAKENNIKIAFENTKLLGYLEYVLDNVKNDNIGICFDIGHCHCFFEDKFNWERFRDRIFAVHLHDNDKSGDQHLLPYDGTINWETILRDLKSANYDGPITLESCYGKNYSDMHALDFYKMSYGIAENLRSLMESF